MADDRPANDDLAGALAELTRRFEDFRTTAEPRMSRRPVGSIEATPLDAPLPDTVFLKGQALARESYPALWQWVRDYSPRGFSTTETTLTLPDWTGRAPVGASTARPAGTLFGAPTQVIAPTHMAAHTHQVSVDAHGTHNHTGSTGADSPSHTHGGGTGADNPSHTHGVHGHSVVGGVAFNPGSGTAPSNPTGSGTGNASNAHTHGFGTGNASNAHDHDFATNQVSAGGHTVRQVAVGENTPLPIEGPSVAVNWLIYC